jgi:hypothetical protein
MTQDFQQELAVYHANLIELLPYAGRFVVIRGQEIQGPFNSPEHAWQTGHRQYGRAPFLVKQIHSESAFAGRAG